MISTFRSLAKNKIFLSILGVLLAIGFTSFGVTGYRSVNKPLVKMKGDDIRYNEFVRHYQQSLANNNLTQLSLAEQTELRLPEKFLQELIIQKLLLKKADDMNLRISEDAVVQAIQHNPIFHDRATGKFSKDLYAQLITTGNINESAIINNTKDNLKIFWLEQYLNGFALPLTGLNKKLAGVLTTPITLDYVVLTTNDLNQPPPIPSDNDLQEFYNNNQTLYQKPEYRQFNIITIPYQAIQTTAFNNITIDDNAITQDYQNRLAEFTPPQEFQVEQLLFNDKATADNFYPTIANQPLQSITPASANYNQLNLDPRTATDYGFNPNDPHGKLSGVVETPFGFAIFRLQKITGGEPQPLSAVRNDIINRLKAEQATTVFNNMFRQISDQLIAGIPPQDIGKEFGIGFTIATTPLINQQGRDKNGNDLTQQYSPAIIQSGFAGDASQVVVTQQPTDNPNQLLALSVIKNEPAFLPPFASIKEQITDDWYNDQAKKILNDTMTSLTEKGFSLTDYQGVKKISFLMTDLLKPAPPIINGINNNQLYNVFLEGQAIILDDSTPRLLLFKPQPAPATTSQINQTAQNQITQTMTETALLALYHDYQVEVDWQQLTNFLNSANAP